MSDLSGFEAYVKQKLQSAVESAIDDVVEMGKMIGEDEASLFYGEYPQNPRFPRSGLLISTPYGTASGLHGEVGFKSLSGLANKKRPTPLSDGDVLSYFANGGMVGHPNAHFESFKEILGKEFNEIMADSLRANGFNV